MPISAHERHLMNGGLLRPVSKSLADTTIHPFATLAARPTASEFGVGHASIVTATYRINCSSDGVSWDSHGSSDSIADRPSAAALGKGSWQVGDLLYHSAGASWKTEKLAKRTNVLTRCPTGTTQNYTGKGGFTFNIQAELAGVPMAVRIAIPNHTAGTPTIAGSFGFDTAMGDINSVQSRGAM